MIENDPQYTDVEQLSQFRDSQLLESFRKIVTFGLEANDSDPRLVQAFSNLFTENAARRLRENPEEAREYMRHVSQICLNGKRGR